MPPKPFGKSKKSAKSPPTSEKGVKRNAISTDSLRSPLLGTSEDWMSFASRACSSQVHPHVNRCITGFDAITLRPSDHIGRTRICINAPSVKCNREAYLLFLTCIEVVPHS